VAKNLPRKVLDLMTMTTTLAYDATAATYDDADYLRPLQEGDTVRCGEGPDDCSVLGAWSDWVWLCALSARNLAPFTARASDCELVKHAEAPRWPYR